MMMMALVLVRPRIFVSNHAECALQPTSSPTEFNDIATESPTNTKSPTLSPSTSPAPTACGDTVSSDKKLKLKNQLLSCPEIVEENKCGSLIYDDDGNSLGKAKFICLQSCGECPTSSPMVSPTTSPTASPAPTVCEDTVSQDTELKLKNQILTCPQIVEENKCGSLIYDDNGNSLGKAKFICVKSCGRCNN